MEIFPERKKGGPKKWKKQKKLQAVLVIYVSLYTYDLHIYKSHSELNPDLLIQLIWYIVAFYCQLIETQCMVGIC